MWPNEQINRISFCGALMNGEKMCVCVCFQRRGEHTHSQKSLSASNNMYINNSSISLCWTGINAVS